MHENLKQLGLYTTSCCTLYRFEYIYVQDMQYYPCIANGEKGAARFTRTKKPQNGLTNRKTRSNEDT